MAITCLYEHDFSEDNLVQCEIYGVNMSKFSKYTSIWKLMEHPQYNDIGYLALNSCKLTNYHSNLEFKYPKKLKILIINYYNDEVNYPDPPDSVIQMKVFGNGLPKLPKNLKLLDFQHTDVTEIKQLPNTLEELYCSKCKIRFLPSLPKTLKVLSCSGCELEELPELPYGIEYINCSHNKLKYLPELPQSVKTLHCNNNQITKLPFSLEKCVMDVSYFEDHKFYIEYAKKHCDQYEYFIFQDNPIRTFIWKNYNGTKPEKNGITTKKTHITNRIKWYFNRLRAVQKIEYEYYKRRYDPKCKFCEYMEIKNLKRLYDEHDMEVEL